MNILGLSIFLDIMFQILPPHYTNWNFLEKFLNFSKSPSWPLYYFFSYVHLENCNYLQTGGLGIFWFDNPLYQTKIFLVLLFAIFWFGLSWGVFSCLVGGAEGIGTIFGWGLYPLCLTWKLLKENEKLRWKQKQKQWVSGVYSVCCWSDRAFIYFSCLIGQHIYLWSNRELCHMRHAIARTNLCTCLNPFVTLSFAHLQQTWTSQGEKASILSQA